MRATLVKNTGIAIEIELGAPSAQTRWRGHSICLTAASRSQRAHAAHFLFHSSTPRSKRNTVTLEKTGGVITDASMPVQVIASTDPISRVLRDSSNRLDFQFHFAANQSKSVFRFMAFQKDASQANDLAIDHFDEYVQETRKYYDTLLSTVEIQTPDRVLDSGFYAALLNLDYAYQSPAWLEAIHQWNAYWVNNYQISAAIDLGQLDRARRALIFFADRPGGPGQTYSDADWDRSIQGIGRMCSSEEGLPYYILELYRYWLATGDRKTLDEVWPATKENLERLLKTRDPDGNMLLNWMLGGNMFLYQSDHLSLPGDAFSPRLWWLAIWTRWQTWRRRAASLATRRRGAIGPPICEVNWCGASGCRRREGSSAGSRWSRPGHAGKLLYRLCLSATLLRSSARLHLDQLADPRSNPLDEESI